jgi:hypothetical protein
VDRRQPVLRGQLNDQLEVRHIFRFKTDQNCVGTIVT